MDFPTSTLRRVATTAGYFVVGVIVTAAVALAVLYISGPIQPVIYGAFYLQVGPSEATETAILTHFLLTGFTALSAVLLTGDYLSDRLAHRTAVTKEICRP